MVFSATRLSRVPDGNRWRYTYRVTDVDETGSYFSTASSHIDYIIGAMPEELATQFVCRANSQTVGGVMGSAPGDIAIQVVSGTVATDFVLTFVGR